MSTIEMTMPDELKKFFELSTQTSSVPSTDRDRLILVLEQRSLSSIMLDANMPLPSGLKEAGVSPEEWSHFIHGYNELHETTKSPLQLLYLCVSCCLYLPLYLYYLCHFEAKLQAFMEKVNREIFEPRGCYTRQQVFFEVSSNNTVSKPMMIMSISLNEWDSDQLKKEKDQLYMLHIEPSNTGSTNCRTEMSA
jgi:hypothetical protein